MSISPAATVIYGPDMDDPEEYPCEPEGTVEKLVAAGGTVLDLSEGGQEELDPQQITPSEPSNDQPVAKYPAIALEGAQPRIVEGTPTDGCECVCHRIAGISHIRACCGGSSAVVATETRSEIEAEGTQQP